MSEVALAAAEVASETRLKRIAKACVLLNNRAEELVNRLDNTKGRILGSYDGPEAEKYPSEAPDRCDIEEVEHQLNTLEGKLDRCHMQMNELEGL